MSRTSNFNVGTNDGGGGGDDGGGGGAIRQGAQMAQGAAMRQGMPGRFNIDGGDDSDPWSGGFWSDALHVGRRAAAFATGGMSEWAIGAGRLTGETFFDEDPGLGLTREEFGDVAGDFWSNSPYNSALRYASGTGWGMINTARFGIDYLRNPGKYGEKIIAGANLARRNPRRALGAVARFGQNYLEEQGEHYMEHPEDIAFDVAAAVGPEIALAGGAALAGRAASRSGQFTRGMRSADEVAEAARALRVADEGGDAARAAARSAEAIGEAAGRGGTFAAGASEAARGGSFMERYIDPLLEAGPRFDVKLRTATGRKPLGAVGRARQQIGEGWIAGSRKTMDPVTGKLVIDPSTGSPSAARQIIGKRVAGGTMRPVYPAGTSRWIADYGEGAWRTRRARDVMNTGRATGQAAEETMSAVNDPVGYAFDKLFPKGGAGKAPPAPKPADEGMVATGPENRIYGIGYESGRGYSAHNGTPKVYENTSYEDFNYEDDEGYD